ncbi:MAG: DUF4199 domain-containing protein [Rikenellaceae bacterium]|nr:DUF4199 domain-containing protein [Rikenellaceae bacterium]
MGERNLSKIFWTEALTGGLVLGVALFFWDLIGYWLDLPLKNSGIASLVQFILITGGIVYFSRRMREFRGPALGFPYGSVFGFTMALMLFTGMVYGVGVFFLQVVIAPGYFVELFEMALVNSSLSEAMIEQTLDMRESMSALMKNPIVYLFSGIFTMVIYGGLVGLIAATFIRRPADPFAGEQPDEDYPTF